MNEWTLSPSLGWIAGCLFAALMVGLALTQTVIFLRHRGTTDEGASAWIRRSLICLLVALMLLTPSMVVQTRNRAVNNTDVMLAVDVTGSMAVNDARFGSDKTISRLDAARDAVNEITDKYRNSSFSAMHFANRGTVDLPLTPDTRAIGNWADTLSIEATSSSNGSSLDVVIDPLLLALKSIRDQHPDDTLVLFLISDGEQTTTQQRRTFSSLRQYLDESFTISVGSQRGGRIPTTDSVASGQAPSEGNNWVKDPATGLSGISKMDPKTMRNVADEMGGSYLKLDAKTTITKGVPASMSNHWRVIQTVKQRKRLWPIVWPLAIGTGLLLAWELGAYLSTSRRLL